MSNPRKTTNLTITGKKKKNEGTDLDYQKINDEEKSNKNERVLKEADDYFSMMSQVVVSIFNNKKSKDYENEIRKDGNNNSSMNLSGINKDGFKGKNLLRDKSSNIDTEKEKFFFKTIFDKKELDLKNLNLLLFNMKEFIPYEKQLDILVHKMISGKIDIYEKAQISNNSDLILTNIFISLSPESYDIMDNINIENQKNLRESILNSIGYSSSNLSIMKECNIEIMAYINSNYIDYRKIFKGDIPFESDIDENNFNNNLFSNDEIYELNEIESYLNKKHSIGESDEINILEDVYTTFENKLIFDYENVHRILTTNSVYYKIIQVSSFEIDRNIDAKQQKKNREKNDLDTMVGFMRKIKNPFLDNYVDINLTKNVNIYSMSDSNLNENISNEQMDINVLNDESNIQNSPIKEKKILKNANILKNIVDKGLSQVIESNIQIDEIKDTQTDNNLSD